MKLDEKKILLAITGGISAYKAYDVIQGLKANGYKVSVMITEAALDFVSPVVLGTLSEGNYITENVNRITHIEEAQSCVAFVVVPATYNIIGKFANGIADDLVSSTFAAVPKDTPKIIFPAMNTVMFNNCTMNLNMLYKFRGCHIMMPEAGMLACGTEGIGKLPKPRRVVEEICDILNPLPNWSSPFRSNFKRNTIDSFSYMDFDWTTDCEIPLHPHVGAFGARRRHDVHKGIDLYAKIGEAVYPVESGEIVDIIPFTGAHAGTPWWEETWGIYVRGVSGIVVYGEISIGGRNISDEPYRIGDLVNSEYELGKVLNVLKKDKGRPTSMLHLELHENGYIHTNVWEPGKPKPEGLLDPTKYLQKLIRL